MRQKKNLYCFECRKTTPHSYAGKESMYEGAGLARIVAAVTTLGMSETSWADKYWQCEVCGNVKKHN